MLYNPKWEVKTDPFTLESLIAWLETMPASAEYDYQNCKGECLYGQYAASMGVSWRESQHADFCSFVYMEVASDLPWTFGAALDRARKIAAI